MAGGRLLAEVPHGPEQPRQSSEAPATERDDQTAQGRPGRINGASLLRCGFDIDMQRCPNCGGGGLVTTSAVCERPVIDQIPKHLGVQPPPIQPAHQEVLHLAD